MIKICIIICKRFYNALHKQCNTQKPPSHFIYSQLFILLYSLFSFFLLPSTYGQHDFDAQALNFNVSTTLLSVIFNANHTAFAISIAVFFFFLAALGPSSLEQSSSSLSSQNPKSCILLKLQSHHCHLSLFVSIIYHLLCSSLSLQVLLEGFSPVFIVIFL